MEWVKDLGKLVIGLIKNDIVEKNIGEIMFVYEFSFEFDECFSEL